MAASDLGWEDIQRLWGYSPDATYTLTNASMYSFRFVNKYVNKRLIDILPHGIVFISLQRNKIKRL